MRNADAPKPLIESTSVSAPCSRSAGASAAMSHATPVDVSLCVSSTPAISRRESASRRARRAAGSTAAPGAVSNGSTTQPYVLAIVGEALSKRTNGARKQPLAGRKEVGDRGLERAGTRASEQQHLAGRPEGRAQRFVDAREHRRKLLVAMIDQWTCGRLEHCLRAGHGAGKE